jgi:hypothetical protein
MAFVNLPDELIYVITEQVKARDIVSLSCISKRLNYICKDTKCNDLYEVKTMEEAIKAYNFNKNIKLKIDLHSTDISEFYTLSNFHTLNFCMCKKLKNVYNLGHVHTLNLSSCEGISDVSMLGGVYDLNLSWCHRVTDVSMLGNVHTLNLSWFQCLIKFIHLIYHVVLK